MHSPTTYIAPAAIVVNTEPGFKVSKSPSAITISVKNYDGTEHTETVHEQSPSPNHSNRQTPSPNNNSTTVELPSNNSTETSSPNNNSTFVELPSNSSTSEELPSNNSTDKSSPNNNTQSIELPSNSSTEISYHNDNTASMKGELRLSVSGTPSVTSQSNSPEEPPDSPHITFKDGGAHWYRSSAVTLNFHK